MESVENCHGLADLFPFAFRRAAEGAAECELVVAAKMIVNLRREFAEIA